MANIEIAAGYNLADLCLTVELSIVNIDNNYAEMSNIMEVYGRIANTELQDGEIEDLGIGIIVSKHIIKVSKGKIKVNEAS